MNRTAYTTNKAESGYGGPDFAATPACSTRAMSETVHSLRCKEIPANTAPNLPNGPVLAVDERLRVWPDG
jgi:hypothetical protein